MIKQPGANVSALSGFKPEFGAQAPFFAEEDATVPMAWATAGTWEMLDMTCTLQKYAFKTMKSMKYQA